MNARPTLLIVSYHFAPSPMVGAKRFSFLAREFSALGYAVHVISNDIWQSPHGREDASLAIHGTVHRCAAPFEVPLAGGGPWRRLANAVLRRLLGPVGLQYFWTRAATRKALAVAAKLPPGVVIGTSPPQAALLAASAVARRLGWPLVLDYRDPWSAYDWPEWHHGRISRWVARRIETRLVRQSAARILNTPAMQLSFEQVFPASHAGNHTIPNGFDPVPVAAAPPDTGPLEIVHAGEIYGKRSLVPLLRAVQRLVAKHPTRVVQITTYGALPPAEWQRIRGAGLEHLIVERPRISFADLFGVLQRAHLLLAVVSDHMLYSTPYKVYDYMAAGRPILGLAPRGAALFELLAQSGAGLCADPQDIDAIEAALERSLFGGLNPHAVRTEPFRWKNLARQYVVAIDQVWLSRPGAKRASMLPRTNTRELDG